jgi:hypothetical protein
MERERAIRLVTLPALLLLVVAIVGALGFLDARSLLHRTWSEPQTVGAPTISVERFDPAGTVLSLPDGSQAVWVVGEVVPVAPPVVESQQRSAGVLSSQLSGARVVWLVGTALPGTLVALGVLALIGAAVGLALRRGGYAPGVLRLLRRVGLVALLGGPVAVLVEYLVAGQYGELTWTPSLGRWAVAMVWVLVGAAFLALGDLVARAGLLRAELDEVI